MLTLVGMLTMVLASSIVGADVPQVREKDAAGSIAPFQVTAFDAASPWNYPSSVVYVENTYLSIAVQTTDSTFTMGTTGGDPANPNDDRKLLLYGHPSPWSSVTTIRVDGTDATFGEPNEGGTYEKIPVVTGEGIESAWVWKGVRVEQILSFERNPATGRDDVMKIRYRLTNLDFDEHSVGTRVMLDTMLGGNDGAPFQIAGTGAVTYEREYSGSSVPAYWEAFDNLASPTVISQGTLIGGGAIVPDLVQYASWPNIVDTYWDYTINPGRSVTSDSAVAVYWNPQTLHPGQSIDFITYYGLSSFSSSTGDLVLSVSAPLELQVIGTEYSPNPITVTGYVENPSTVRVENVRATLNLPPELTLEPGSPASQEIGGLDPGATASVYWNVRATPQPTATQVEYKVVLTGDGITDQEAARTLSLPPLSGNTPPIAEFTFDPAEPWTGELVQFTDRSSDLDGTIASRLWTFGDGGTSIELNPTHAYAAEDTYLVTLTVTDDDGAVTRAEQTIVVILPPAPTVDLGGPYAGQEGSDVTLTATVSSSAAIAKCEWDFDGDLSFDHRTTTEPSTEYTWGDVYTGTVGIRVTDINGRQGTDTASISIANVAPTVSGVTVPADPVAVGTTTSASANYAHPGNGITTAIWTWGDGTTSAGTVGSATVTGTHAYTMPGIYLVAVTLADDDGGSASAEAMVFVVVYDPNGGFVTGGGWITSPAGAYPADAGMAGKANFGFVSKYQKGKTVPTGQTQFEFSAADFTFHSTAYDWLVVAGSKAQYKGSGTVNGEGVYGFMLTAVDGSPDRFRLKIWEKGTDTIVYDNQMGAADTAGLTTTIGGGSIVIQSR